MFEAGEFFRQRHEERIKNQTRLINQDPNNAEAYFDRGEEKQFLGQDEEAIKDYTEAIRLKPDRLIPYFHRGVCEFKLDKNEEALKDLERVIELNPIFEKEVERYLRIIRLNLTKPQTRLKPHRENINMYLKD